MAQKICTLFGVVISPGRLCLCEPDRECYLLWHLFDQIILHAARYGNQSAPLPPSLLFHCFKRFCRTSRSTHVNSSVIPGASNILLVTELPFFAGIWHRLAYFFHFFCCGINQYDYIIFNGPIFISVILRLTNTSFFAKETNHVGQTKETQREPPNSLLCL